MAIPRFACLLTSALLAAACSSPVMASEAELCQAQNLGSAIGAGACFDAQLRAAALKLVELEVSYASSVLSTSNNPPYAKRVLEAEAKQWRTYRAAKCELFGETEGGSDAWKNAWAASCEVAESNTRIESLRKALANRPSS